MEAGKGSLMMERPMHSMIIGLPVDGNGGSGMEEPTGGLAQGAEETGGHPTAHSASAAVQPRDAGHYVCSCDTGSTSFAIPPELQLFAASRQSRNVLWRESVTEAAAPGSDGLSPDLAERPPPRP